MRYKEARIQKKEMRGQMKAQVKTVVEKPPLRVSQICAYARSIEARVSQICAYARDRVKLQVWCSLKSVTTTLGILFSWLHILHCTVVITLGNLD